MSDLVVVRDLVKSFGEGEAATHVLRKLNLRLAQGDFIALLGRSGSGKSTLLSILGTLMRPLSGSYFMLGRDMTNAGDAELTAFRNRHIGFVFQFHHLLPDFTALENVVFPAAVGAGRERREALERGRALLERVGLSDRIHFRTNEISGGQKQRVAIARALMNQPKLVLADEPTGNLDRESANQVMDLLRQINEEERTTFLISTHDEKIAAACARRIHIVDGVAIAEDGDGTSSLQGQRSP